jgi:hypothetical protein
MFLKKDKAEVIETLDYQSNKILEEAICDMQVNVWTLPKP